MKNIFCEVTSDPLDISRYVELVADPGAGAISTFTGVTRNNFQGKTVIKLDYEAYTPMALKKLQVRSASGVVPSRHLGPCEGKRVPFPLRPKVSTNVPQELAHQVTNKWSVCKVAIAHRVGTVLVGEPSVIIAVSSAHRRESLEVRLATKP